MIINLRESSYSVWIEYLLAEKDKKNKMYFPLFIVDDDVHSYLIVKLEYLLISVLHTYPR